MQHKIILEADLLAYNHSQITINHNKKFRRWESRHRTSPTFPDIISSFSLFIPSFFFFCLICEKAENFWQCILKIFK